MSKKRILYIGQYSEGATSKMRADELKNIIGTDCFDIIDTNIPFFNSSKWIRAVGFRYKVGPLISRINRFIIKNLKKRNYDLIWVDKAIFITKNTTEQLRESTDKLVHFTPDCAFYANSSTYFNSSVALYDKLVTTKSFEMNNYNQLVSANKIVLVTQGFYKQIHRVNQGVEKKKHVLFIGLCEPSREDLLSFLVENGVFVVIAGFGWEKFNKKYLSTGRVNYLGSGVFSKEYSQLISSSYFALGCLSKKFPETHTTRTFEIPACGTILVTEKNDELASFYNEDEVVFYENKLELINKLNYLFSKPQEMQLIAAKGHSRVHRDGRDYASIIKNVLDEVYEY